MLSYKNFQKFDCKLEIKTPGKSFLRFVCHPFCELAQHYLFPLAWIYTIVYAVIESEPQWSAYGSTTYLYHANTDLIMTMCLI